MKKPMLVSVIVAVMLLAIGIFAPCHAQSPTKDDTPTFYHLVPGTYVNGWPRFTIHYPKDWVEHAPPFGGGYFQATAPGHPPEGYIIVGTGPPFPLPVEKWADFRVSVFKAIGTDVTVVSDKSSRLRDGTPAREVEIRALINGALLHDLSLATMRGDTMVFVGVGSLTREVGDDLKAILYSLEFQPGHDEQVKVPADVQKLLDKYRDNLVAHDLPNLMTCYSDRFLNSGMTKGQAERVWRQYIDPITSVEVTITEFIPAGDRAYLAGSATSYWGKTMLKDISIIKENGEWKWYGNQRNVAPD